jgi:hypothetical protein
VAQESSSGKQTSAKARTQDEADFPSPSPAEATPSSSLEFVKAVYSWMQVVQAQAVDILSRNQQPAHAAEAHVLAHVSQVRQALDQATADAALYFQAGQGEESPETQPEK